MFAPFPARIESSLLAIDLHPGIVSTTELSSSDLSCSHPPTLSETMNHAYGGRGTNGEGSSWTRAQDDRPAPLFATPRAAESGRTLPPASSLVASGSLYQPVGPSDLLPPLANAYAAPSDTSGRSFSFSSHSTQASPVTEQQPFPMHHQHCLSPVGFNGGETCPTNHGRTMNNPSVSAHIGHSAVSMAHYGTHSTHPAHPFSLQSHPTQSHQSGFRPYEGHGSYPPMGSYTSAMPQGIHPYAHPAASLEYRSHFFNPFEVKHRRRTTKSQFQILEGTFQEIPKPNAALRKALSVQLDMPPRAVQIWFQNRRAKAKAMVKKEAASKDPSNGESKAESSALPDTSRTGLINNDGQAQGSRIPHSYSDLGLSSSTSGLSGYHGHGSSSSNASDDGQAPPQAQHGQPSADDGGLLRLSSHAPSRQELPRTSSTMLGDRHRYNHTLANSWLGSEGHHGQQQQPLSALSQDVSYGDSLGKHPYSNDHAPAGAASAPSEAISLLGQYDPGRKSSSFSDIHGHDHGSSASLVSQHPAHQLHTNAGHFDGGAPIYPSGLAAGYESSTAPTSIASLAHPPGPTLHASAVFPDDYVHGRRASCPEGVPNLPTVHLNASPASHQQFLSNRGAW